MYIVLNGEFEVIRSKKNKVDQSSNDHEVAMKVITHQINCTGVKAFKIDRKLNNMDLRIAIASQG
jgi:hypothetical protein